jgi:hypothetical protein
MSDNMNSRIFARKWLERNGLFDKDSDYDGALGAQVMEVVELIASQGHSGGSAARLYDILQRIYNDYDNNDSPLWQEYWQSPEGQALIQQFTGQAPPQGGKL